MRRRSLQGQLVLWLLPLHLLTTAVLGWLFADNYGETVQQFMDGQMQALVQANAARSCASLAAPLPQLDADAVHDAGEFVVQLWCRQDPARRVASMAVDVPWQGAPGWHAVQAGGVRWRAFAGEDDGGEVRVQVLQSEIFRSSEVAGRAFFASLVGLLLLPVSLGVLALVVGRVSRRLRRSAQQLARRDEHSRTPPVMQVPREIEPLVQSFEALLARLRESLASQRRFVQDAAHELRTPLTALNLQLENLRPHLRGAEGQFAELEGGLRRAQHLVEQMLALSRQEAGAAPLAELELRSLLRASVGQAMAAADRRGIDVGLVDRLDGPLQLRAAEGELRSVFDNLLDNALRHTPPGGEVELCLHALPGGGRCVDIADTGPGLPADMRERVFDRFFRMPDAPAGGSGLGLAIARQAGLKHGLRIELLDREDGRAGLVARVHLP